MSTSPIPFVPLLCLLVVSAGVTGCGSSTTTVIETGGGQTTQVRVLAPFTSTGQATSGFQVSRTIRGSCFSGSEADNRSDAWRCMTGNEIVDPCFGGSQAPAGELLCPKGPFSSEAVLMQLTGKLPFNFADSGSPGDGLPWGVKLGTGEECELAQGAGADIGGKRVNYYCAGSDVSLAGDPDRSSQPWTILGRQGQATDLRPVRIAEAVF